MGDNETVALIRRLSWGSQQDADRPFDTRSVGAAAKLARAITEAGYAVVKLPEPEPREDDAEIATCWDHLPHQVLIWDSHQDEVQYAYNFEPAEPMSAEEAEALGAAFIAAARSVRQSRGEGQ